MPEAIRNVVDLFVQEIRNVLGEDLKKVIVYGSYARGDYREGSDVDVMLEFPQSTLKKVDDFN